MKSFLLFVFFAVCCLSIAKAQLGNACSNPLILSVNDSMCVSPQMGSSQISSVLDSITPAFFNNWKIKPQARIWYKFTAPSKNVAIRLNEIKYFTIQVYRGTCNALTEINAFSTYISQNNSMDSGDNETIIGAIENLIPGQDYYIVVSSTDYPYYTFASVCLYKIPDKGSRIVSKPQGGPWLSKSSWIQGRVPTPIDTAVIADGSTINIDVQGTYAVKNLEIGEGGAGAARLLFQTEQNRFSIYGDLIIKTGDSLIGKKGGIFGDRYILYGNIVNNGIVNYIKNIPPSPSKRPGFHFKSLNHQTVSGTGKFLGIGIPCLVIDNPAGVKWNVSGYCQSQIYLRRGLFDNSAANITFSDTSYQAWGTGSALSIVNGSLSKFVRNIETTNPEFKKNVLQFAEISDDVLRSNKEINLDDYYPIGTKFSRLEIAKPGGKKVIANRSVKLVQLVIQKNGILKGQPGDTLTMFSCAFSAVSPIQHVEFDYYKSLPAVSTSSTVWNVPAIVAGKGRSFGIVNYLIGAPIGNVIQAHIINSPPSGIVNAPGTFMMGPHVIEIKSNTAHAPTAKLRMELFDSDGLVGLKNTWRIAQAPTPNGPWTLLDVTGSYVAPGDPLLEAIFTTTNPISLANGNYFGIASTGQASEAILTRVLPVATYPFGCGGSQTTTVKMLVANNGLSNLTNLLVGAVAGGNFYSRSYITGVNWTNSLAVGGVDTFRFEIPGTLSGNLPIKYFVSAPADGNRANDTIKGYLNTQPLPLPVWINFDTCQYMRLQSLGINKFGHPIVNGWENGPTGPISSSGTYGNCFIISKEASSSNLYLLARLFMLNGSGMLKTSEYGPIGASSWFRYKFNIVDVAGISNEIRSGDTIWIEASGNCGQSYTRLRTIHKGNSITYMDPTGGQMEDGLGPISEWKDSLPFPAGSLVHFRIRMKGATGFSNGIFYMDNFQVKDSIQVGNAPLQLAKRDLLLYPNPAGEEVFFQLPEGETAGAIRLVDLLGRETHLEADAENRIRLKAISSGVYMLVVKGTTASYWKRLVKR